MGIAKKCTKRPGVKFNISTIRVEFDNAGSRSVSCKHWEKGIPPGIRRMRDVKVMWWPYGKKKVIDLFLSSLTDSGKVDYFRC